MQRTRDAAAIADNRTFHNRYSPTADGIRGRQWDINFMSARAELFFADEFPCNDELIFSDTPIYGAEFSFGDGNGVDVSCSDSAGYLLVEPKKLTKRRGKEPADIFVLVKYDKRKPEPNDCRFMGWATRADLLAHPPRLYTSKPGAKPSHGIVSKDLRKMIDLRIRLGLTYQQTKMFADEDVPTKQDTAARWTS